MKNFTSLFWVSFFTQNSCSQAEHAAVFSAPFRTVMVLTLLMLGQAVWAQTLQTSIDLQAPFSATQFPALAAPAPHYGFGTLGEFTVQVNAAIGSAGSAATSTLTVTVPVGMIIRQSSQNPDGTFNIEPISFHF